MPDNGAWWLLDQILSTRLHVVIGVLILWGLIGALAGALPSALASWLLSRLGAFRLVWRHRTWLKIAAIVWIIGVCSLLGCSLGLIEGAVRGVGIVVRESSFRTEVLVPLGAKCAAGIASMDCFLVQGEHKKNPEDPLELSEEQEAFLTRFSEGNAELDVHAFLGRLENVEGVFVDAVVRKILARLRERSEIEEGSFSESILAQFLPGVMRWAIRQKANDELERLGLAEGVWQFLEKLRDAAAESGDPATITFDELAIHSVDNGVVPVIVPPVRKTARAKQTSVVLLLLGAVLLPVLLFWLGRYLERRTTAHRSQEDSEA